MLCVISNMSITIVSGHRTGPSSWGLTGLRTEAEGGGIAHQPLPGRAIITGEELREDKNLA